MREEGETRAAPHCNREGQACVALALDQSFSGGASLVKTTRGARVVLDLRTVDPARDPDLAMAVTRALAPGR